jgi:hypothetical protein
MFDGVHPFGIITDNPLNASLFPLYKKHPASVSLYEEYVQYVFRPNENIFGGFEAYFTAQIISFEEIFVFTILVYVSYNSLRVSIFVRFSF